MVRYLEVELGCAARALMPDPLAKIKRKVTVRFDSRRAVRRCADD